MTKDLGHYTYTASAKHAVQSQLRGPISSDNRSIDDSGTKTDTGRFGTTIMDVRGPHPFLPQTFMSWGRINIKVHGSGVKHNIKLYGLCSRPVEFLGPASYDSQPYRCSFYPYLPHPPGTEPPADRYTRCRCRYEQAAHKARV